MERDYLIAVYFEGYAYFLRRGPSSGNSVFGGAPPVMMAGIRETILEPDKLHYVGNVSHRDIPPLASHVSDIPLFYGFTFDGCDLRYELESPSKLNLMDLRPARPSVDYPYPNYPKVFPRIPLMLGRKQFMTYAQFANDYPNLPEDQPSDIIVVVPPPASIGISLWGEYGDDVTVVFECNLLLGTVNAYSHCT